MNYEKQSIPELEAEINRLDQAMNVLLEKKRLVAKALDAKLVMAEALRKIERMSDPERAALAKVLNPDGVVSQEQLGVIGRMIAALRGA